MFDASTRIGLGKREERGLVRTTILRRWGIPQTPRNSPVNAQNPGHDGGAGLQPEVHFILRHSNHRRAMLRRCSRSLTSPEAIGCPVHLFALTMVQSSSLPLVGRNQGWGWSQPPERGLTPTQLR